jgi:lysophospholipase L1-like esterase
VPVTLGVLALLAVAECVARQPFVREPSPFRESSPGHVQRSEAWVALLDFDVALVPSRPRVVWLGASTVAGVPYMPHMSPPAWLEYVLASRGADVEVVPLAGPGLSAEALVRLFPFALELQPDLIVVTTGHNEYLNTSELLDRRWWQDVQLVVRARTLLGHEPSSAERLPTPEHDFDHAAIAASFRQALAAMQASADDAGVVLLFTAPLENLRENPPILGDDPRLPEDADTAIARGQALLAAGDVVGARAALLAARDRDRWPHRATTPLVVALRETARRLLPVDEAFDAVSPHGIAGFELFADHCHPNPAGQRLLASLVADAIEELGLIPPTGRLGQAPELADGLHRFRLDDDALYRARATLARGYLGFAMISGRWGRMAEFAEQNLREALAGEEGYGELETSFAMPALLRGDVEAARAALAAAAGTSPAMLRRLQLAYNRYPWVRATFERNGLRMEQMELLPASAAGP